MPCSPLVACAHKSLTQEKHASLSHYSQPILFVSPFYILGAQKAGNSMVLREQDIPSRGFQTPVINKEGSLTANNMAQRGKGQCQLPADLHAAEVEAPGFWR
jgi:hypothetical protein